MEGPIWHVRFVYMNRYECLCLSVWYNETWDTIIFCSNVFSFIHHLTYQHIIGRRRKSGQCTIKLISYILLTKVLTNSFKVKATIYMLHYIVVFYFGIYVIADWIRFLRTLERSLFDILFKMLFLYRCIMYTLYMVDKTYVACFIRWWL